MSNAAKYFDILTTNSVVLPNYFDPAQLFFRFISKFLDFSAKLFF